MSSNYYNNQKPLVCCENPDLHRQVGVAIYGPFENLKGDLLVDATFERVSVNTCTFGKNIPVGEAAIYAIANTEKVIENLTKVLLELHEHRQRLQAELERLKRDGISQPNLFEVQS